MEKLSIEDMAVFCKRKGFVYPNSEIYGSFSGFWDFGHLGAELKNNIKRAIAEAGPSRFCLMISEDVPPDWQRKIPLVLNALEGL